MPKMTFILKDGSRKEVEAPLGLSVMYEDDQSITHNLRTAIVDPNGRLVKVYTGNDWTPDQVLTDLGSGSGRIS